MVNFFFIYLFRAARVWNSKFVLSPNQNSVGLIFNQPFAHSPQKKNEASIQNLNITNQYRRIDSMDETDYTLKKSFGSSFSEKRRGGGKMVTAPAAATRVFCCGDSLNVKSLLGRPGGAVQIVTRRVDENDDDTLADDDDDDDDGDDNGDEDANNDNVREDYDDVKVGAGVGSGGGGGGEGSGCRRLSTIIRSPSRFIDKSNRRMSSHIHLDKISSLSHDGCLETLSEDESGRIMPSTSSRSQNDLIQFVFTSHGIRVISDKEYVV